MEYVTFEKQYRRVLNVVRLVGYPFHWMEGSPRWKAFFRVYYKLFFLLTTYMLGCVIASILLVPGLSDLSSMLVSGTLSFTAFFTTIYFFGYEAEVLRLLKSFEALEHALKTSSIGHPEVLSKEIAANCRFVTILAYVSVPGIIAAAHFFILPIPLPGIQREAFPLWLLTGFHGSVPRDDPVSVGWKTMTLGTVTAKKLGLDSFFIMLFRIQVVYSRHLRLIMKKLRSDESIQTDDDLQAKLVQWINMQEMLIRNNIDLIAMFSPIIIMYYVSLLTMFACSIYVLLLNEATDFLRRIMVVLWLVSLLMVQYLFCAAADELTIESEKMAMEAYSLPFYRFGKKCGNTIRQVIMFANRPIQVTAYRAETFLLNREIFLAFVFSAVSAYVTLEKLIVD